MMRLTSSSGVCILSWLVLCACGFGTAGNEATPEHLSASSAYGGWQSGAGGASINTRKRASTKEGQGGTRSVRGETDYLAHLRSFTSGEEKRRLKARRKLEENKGSSETDEPESKPGERDSDMGRGEPEGEEENERWEAELDGIPPMSVLQEMEQVIMQEEQERAAKEDPWSKELRDAAYRYNTSKIERMLRQARDLHPPGSYDPIQVQLPGGTWIDAAKITTGQLIEALNTDGHGLPRDSQGRVIPPRNLPRQLRKAEPLRSLLAHRLENGLDVYSDPMSEEEGAEAGEQNGALVRNGALVERQDLEGWEWDAGDLGDMKEKEYVDELLDEELGPYKEAWERYFFGAHHSQQDERKVLEWAEWREELKVHRAKGQRKLDLQLVRALQLSDTDYAHKLVQRGANVSALDSENGLRPIHHAVVQHNLEAMGWLVQENGAFIDARDSSGRTALMLAAGAGDAKMVEWLLEHGANTTAVDDELWTIMHYFAMSVSGERETAQALLRRDPEEIRALLCRRNSDGRTPKAVAESEGLISMADMLGAIADGERYEETVLGRGLEVPEHHFRLLEGGSLFVDSDDAEYDPKGLESEKRRAISKASKRNAWRAPTVDFASLPDNFEHPFTARLRPYRT